MKFKIIQLLLIALLSFNLLNGNPSAKNNLNKNLSLTFNQRQLNKYINTTIEQLDEDYRYAIKQKIGSFLGSRLAIFKSIDTISKDPLLVRQGMYGFWKLARKAALLNLKENPELNRATNGKYFSYRKGKDTKKDFKENSFSILSFNVCFTPDHMPIFFGGMLPWKARIDRISKFIDKQDADVICLQEMFDPEAHDALYSKLKTKYTYFYTHIGPWHFNGSLSSLGFKSGLFVASKRPIRNPIFTPFKKDNPHINRGVFSFDVARKDGTIIGSVFTTHLEPFDTGKKLREKELAQTIALMNDKKLNSLPIILCGDLNLPPNEAKKWINTYFEDNIDINNLKVEQKNLTSFDFTTQRLGIKNIDQKPEYLDYMLLLKSHKKNNMKTSVIKTFDIDHLDKALSDHYALFSEITV